MQSCSANYSKVGSASTTTVELQSLAVAGSASVCCCGRQFGCVKALAMHQWQVHQQHAPEFILVKDLICPWRLKNFWADAAWCAGVQQEELIIDDAEIRLEATAVQGPKLPNALPGESELLHARDQLQWLFTSKLRKWVCFVHGSSLDGIGGLDDSESARFGERRTQRPGL